VGNERRGLAFFDFLLADIQIMAQGAFHRVHLTVIEGHVEGSIVVAVYLDDSNHLSAPPRCCDAGSAQELLRRTDAAVAHA